MSESVLRTALLSSSTELIVDALYSTQFFRFYEQHFTLNPEALRSIASLLTLESYQQPRHFSRENDRVQKVFIIVSGEISVLSRFTKQSSATTPSEELVLATLHPGDCLGDIETRRRTTSCITTSSSAPVECAVIHSADFAAIMPAHSGRYWCEGVLHYDFLRILDDQYAEFCLRLSTEKRVKLNSIISSEGDLHADREFYLITQGDVEITNTIDNYSPEDTQSSLLPLASGDTPSRVSSRRRLKFLSFDVKTTQTSTTTSSDCVTLTCPSTSTASTQTTSSFIAALTPTKPLRSLKKTAIISFGQAFGIEGIPSSHPIERQATGNNLPAPPPPPPRLRTQTAKAKSASTWMFVIRTAVYMEFIYLNQKEGTLFEHQSHRRKAQEHKVLLHTTGGVIHHESVWGGIHQRGKQLLQQHQSSPMTPAASQLMTFFHPLSRKPSAAFQSQAAPMLIKTQPFAANLLSSLKSPKTLDIRPNTNSILSQLRLSRLHLDQNLQPQQLQSKKSLSTMLGQSEEIPIKAHQSTSFNRSGSTKFKMSLDEYETGSISSPKHSDNKCVTRMTSQRPSLFSQAVAAAFSKNEEGSGGSDGGDIPHTFFEASTISASTTELGKPRNSSSSSKSHRVQLLSHATSLKLFTSSPKSAKKKQKKSFVETNFNMPSHTSPSFPLQVPHILLFSESQLREEDEEGGGETSKRSSSSPTVKSMIFPNPKKPSQKHQAPSFTSAASSLNSSPSIRISKSSASVGNPQGNSFNAGMRSPKKIQMLEIRDEFYAKKYRRAFNDAACLHQQQIKPSSYLLFNHEASSVRLQSSSCNGGIGEGEDDRNEKLLQLQKKHEFEKMFPRSEIAEKVTGYFKEHVAALKGQHEANMRRVKLQKGLDVKELCSRIAQKINREDKKKKVEVKLAAAYYNFIADDKQ